MVTKFPHLDGVPAFPSEENPFGATFHRLEPVDHYLEKEQGGLLPPMRPEDSGNMSPRHQRAVADVAEYMNLVFIVKGVSAASFHYREHGVDVETKNGDFAHRPVAAKGQDVKGKSGPSGFIPVDQSQNKIGKYLEENPDLPPEEVAVKKDEIASLQKKVDKLIADEKAIAVKVKTEDGEQEVLADLGGRPYVADYDLLTIGTPKKMRLNADFIPLEATGYGRTTRNDICAKHNLMEAMANADIKAKKVSRRVQNYNPEKVSRSYLTASISHGADVWRPGKGEALLFSEKEPMVAFTPDRQVFYLSSPEMFKAFIETWRKRDYHIPVHKDWGVDIAPEENIDPRIDFKKLNLTRFSSGAKAPKRYKTINRHMKGNLVKRMRWQYHKANRQKEIDSIDDPTKRELAQQILNTQDKALRLKQEDLDIKGYDAKMKEMNKLEWDYQQNYGGRPSPVGREAANHMIVDYLEARALKDERELAIAANRIMDNKYATMIIRAFRSPKEYGQLLLDVQKPVPRKYKCAVLKRAESAMASDKSDKKPDLSNYLDLIGRVEHYQHVGAKGKRARREETRQYFLNNKNLSR